MMFRYFIAIRFGHTISESTLLHFSVRVFLFVGDKLSLISTDFNMRYCDGLPPR